MLRRPSVLKLAADSDRSAYDREYVSLVQDSGVPLVTSDSNLLSKFGSTAAAMRVFCP